MGIFALVEVAILTCILLKTPMARIRSKMIRVTSIGHNSIQTTLQLLLDYLEVELGIASIPGRYWEAA